MTLIQIKTWAHFESFLLKNKQEMYTMDPGRQIHFQKKIWEKQKFGEKTFDKKFFGKKV